MNLIRDKTDFVRANFERRKNPSIIKMLDDLLDYDKKWRVALQEAEKLKAKRNAISRSLGGVSQKDKEAKIKETREITDKINKIEIKVVKFEERVNELRKLLPNLIHESVPYGSDDSENVEIRKWGKFPEFDFNPKSSTEILEGLGIADIERAAKVSGSRFYYLKNELVLLNLALQRFALEHLFKKGYELIEPPFMIKRKAMEGMVPLSDFEDVIYKVEGEDLHLIATAEHPLGSMHMDEIIEKEKLPLKYAGVSPCFRKEAGSHGKDTKGIFRVHQFDKIEQFIFSKPEDSWTFHEELINNAEELYKALKIPYRIVNICTGDLGVVASKKYDLEGWFPGQGKYRELCSCSNCTDYQSRRAGIKYRPEPHLKSEYIHTLNATAVAIQRTICCIIENYQTNEGFRIPKVLQEYMLGIKEVKLKNKQKA